jgi:hypothetical protein
VKGMGNIDWNALKRYTSPQAIKDFNVFLDALPLNVGYNALIAAGMAWIIAGVAVLFTSMEVEKVSKLRTELAKVVALKPPIPIIQYIPVPEASLKDIEKKISDTYKGISFAGGASSLTVSAADTDYFPQFLAAVNTLQNGGRNWRMGVTSLCVGRDCTGSKLSAAFKLEIAKVGEAPKEPEPGSDDKPEEAEKKK